MSATGGPEQPGYSRKSFLTRLGVGAIAVGSGGIAGVARASAAPHDARAYSAINHNHFTRIFPKLRSFASQDARVEAALKTSASRAACSMHEMRSTRARSC
jgi:hypothetical protein